MTQRNTGENKNRRNHKSTMVKILVILLIILGVLTGIAAYILTRSKPEEPVERNFDIEPEDETVETIDETAPTLNEDKMGSTLAVTEEETEITTDAGWVHYLLLGIDIGKEGADPTSYEKRRSDAMIVLSINEEDQEVILSSVPRDTLVYIQGRGFDKLTHAYHYGGADLTVETFEENFDMDIAGYITVNFSAMTKIVDTLGGITITLTDAEASHMGSQYAAWGLSGGTQVLNGSQALAYCRVRKIDSDYVRTDRQFKTLKAIYEKVKGASFTTYVSLITDIYPEVHTDLTLQDCISLAGTVLNILDSSELINAKLVDSQHSTTPYLNRVSYVMVDDLEETVIRWRENVLGISDYVPSASVSAISEELKHLVD